MLKNAFCLLQIFFEHSKSRYDFALKWPVFQIRGTFFLSFFFIISEAALFVARDVFRYYKRGCSFRLPAAFFRNPDTVVANANASRVWTVFGEKLRNVLTLPVDCPSSPQSFCRVSQPLKEVMFWISLGLLYYLTGYGPKKINTKKNRITQLGNTTYFIIRRSGMFYHMPIIPVNFQIWRTGRWRAQITKVRHVLLVFWSIPKSTSTLSQIHPKKKNWHTCDDHRSETISVFRANTPMQPSMVEGVVRTWGYCWSPPVPLRKNEDREDLELDFP